MITVFVRTAGFAVAFAAYISAWFALVEQNFGYALLYGICAFIIWLVTLEIRGLLND